MDKNKWPERLKAEVEPDEEMQVKKHEIYKPSKTSRIGYDDDKEGRDKEL